MISIFKDNTFQLPPPFLCTQKKTHTPQPSAHGSSLSPTDTTPNCFVPRSDLHPPLSMPLFMLSPPLQSFCPVPLQTSRTFALRPCPLTRRAPPGLLQRKIIGVSSHARDTYLRLHSFCQHSTSPELQYSVNPWRRGPGLSLLSLTASRIGPSTYEAPSKHL